MIAFVCQFYGWSYQDVLHMPMKAFTQFHKQASIMEAIQYRELLDIARTPVQNLDWYKTMRARYNSMIYTGPKKLPPSPPDMYLPSNSPDRKDIVLGIFRAAKRGMGYG